MTIDKTMTKHLTRCLTEGLASVTDFTSDAEILRVAIQAELDAINFYEQMASKAVDQGVADLLLDVAYEEKVHVGEFREMLAQIDPTQVDADAEGAEEVSDLGEIDDA